MKPWGYVASCLFAVALLSQAVQGQQPPEPRKLTSNSSNAIASTPDFGAIANGIYHNTAFGFTCKIPYGWVDRTPEISEDPNPDSNATKKFWIFFSVFEASPLTFCLCFFFRKPGHKWAGGSLVGAIFLTPIAQRLCFCRGDAGVAEEKIQYQCR